MERGGGSGGRMNRSRDGGGGGRNSYYTPRGRGRGRGRGRDSPLSSSSQPPTHGETNGSAEVLMDGTDVSSQSSKFSSWTASRSNSKHHDHILNHRCRTQHNYSPATRNFQPTPNSSRGNYPSLGKEQMWKPVETAREINEVSVVNPEFIPSKSATPTAYGLKNEPSGKEEQFAQTPHEKLNNSNTGRHDNSGCKNLPSRSALSDPGNRHSVVAKGQGQKPEDTRCEDFPSLSCQSAPSNRRLSVGKSQWEKPGDIVSAISKVTLLDTELTPRQSCALIANRELVEKEKLSGQTSDEKLSSVENLNVSSPEKPFDICPEKPKNLVRLNAPLLFINREKRNAMKRSIERREIHKLRPGMILLKSYISISDQVNIVKVCRKLGLGHGGFYQHRYRDGAEMHLKMMCLGLNWDPNTGKYENIRPTDSAKPPVIPDEFHKLVKAAIEESHSYLQKQKPSSKNVEETLPSMSPNICIVNFYSKSGKLGLHQDKDESAESLTRGLPVVSISVGDSAEFLYGDDGDPEKAEKVVLESGDVLLFGGKSRRVFHGVTSIIADTAPKTLLEATNFRSPGRLNLTFRQF